MQGRNTRDVKTQTYSKSFKNKKAENAPKLVIFKNVHEPIIDRETFDSAN